MLVGPLFTLDNSCWATYWSRDISSLSVLSLLSHHQIITGMIWSAQPHWSSAWALIDVGYTGAWVGNWYGVGTGISGTLWVPRDASVWADSRSGNPIYTRVLVRLQIAKYFPKASDGKFDVTQTTSFIYQMNHIFKENSDLESVFEQILYCTC